MKKIIKILDSRIEAWLLIIFLASSSVLIFVQVIARKGFNSSISWSEAAARYMFVWLVYIGISYAVKTKQHIRVDLLTQVRWLPKKGKVLVTIVADIIFLLFALFVCYISIIQVQKLAKFGQTSALFEVKMWAIYLAIPLGFGLTSLRLVQNLIQEFSVLKKYNIGKSIQKNKQGDG